MVRRGYDQGQVDTHLRRLDAEIQILATDRDAALDQSAQLARELDDARARTERLRVQVRSLVSPPQSVQGMSERMRSMLRLAEDEAGEMLSQAEHEVKRRIRTPRRARRNSWPRRRPNRPPCAPPPRRSRPPCAPGPRRTSNAGADRSRRPVPNWPPR